MDWSIEPRPGHAPEGGSAKFDRGVAAAARSSRARHTRTYRIECVSCQGSGLSHRPLIAAVGYETCQGCEGKGWVNVVEVVS